VIAYGFAKGLINFMYYLGDLINCHIHEVKVGQENAEVNPEKPGILGKGNLIAGD
jgi:hypothetical protein